MNDPWDVKSVRQSGQYVSCMKINGVPLLPPVLSKECRNEMQYYKLLAKEVEKRISLLKSYVTESDTDSSEDKTDAPEIPEYEQSYELPPEDIQAGFNINIDKITAITNEKPIDKSPAHSPDFHPSSDTYNSITSNILIETIPTKSSPKLVIDLSLSINETGKNVLESVKKTPPIDLPEHDYPKKLRDIELLTDIDTVEKDKGKSIVKDIVNFSFDVEKNTLGKSDPIPDLPLSQDGPSSLSSKSFTGSLIDIHTESVKEAQKMPKLIRQRSYTVLQPSPQLLAHLEVQSLNTGVDMTSISMSDSISNLSLQNKKRRSWDLESAKVKWSSMALELQKSVPNNVKCKNSSVKSTVKKAEPSPPRRARSIVQDKLRHSTATPKILPKTEPIQKPKKSLSPLRNISSSRTIVKEPASPITNGPNKESSSLKHTPQLISESEDPATRVKELYERIQKQQLIQMANLVEKQKREQILLQQVFDEQNNLLYKQLKTICPKSSIEAKEAWGEVQSNHGPVSLSQLINHKSPEQSSYDSTISATLTETNSCLNQSENLLKKSRDITGSIKKQQSKSQSLNSNRNQSRPPSTNCKIPSANNRSTSRRLNYDTSASTDKDYEPLLTDRTNDTMADLNVTFPSDHSNECQPFNHTLSNPVTNCGDLALVHGCPTNLVSQCVLTDKSMKNMEKCVQKPVTNNACAKPSAFHRPPTVQELAAATKIVAYAKGYLVRRLMRTERVQATVQTIKDALLCALQLHQDREGIRGADVDLHRRLIQQITAACYSLHDTFVTSSPAERCALIAADRDRGRRRSLATRPPPLRHHSQSDV